jgi:O-succinylhomoserine sulfhydrylase
MDRHCDNALAIAKHLEVHPKVESVVYPFLSSYAQNDIAIKQMKKGGGIVTVYLKGGKEEGAKFLNALNIFSLTANLGDARSIATHPSSTTHSKLSAEDKQQVGIKDNLIRFSVGLENITDLLEDIEQALSKI